MIWIALRRFPAVITNFLLDEPIKCSLVSFRVSEKITRRLEYCQILRIPDKENKMGDLLPNTKELLTRFFAAPYEIRAIKEGPKMNRVFSTVRSDWTTGWTETRKSLSDINKSSNVFITLNPLLDSAAEKAVSKNGNLKAVTRGGGIRDDEIAAYRWVLVDIDPVRKAETQGVSSTDEEKDAAWEVGTSIRAFLKEKGFCDPVICDSGNGYHLHYRISLPNDGETRALVKQFLSVLAGKFTSESAKVDTTVYNPARIIKLYGTVARKGNDTEERPHRKSGFIEFPLGAELKVNSKDLLEAVAGKVEAKQSVDIPDEGKQLDRVEWVRSFMEDHGILYWEETNRSGEVKFYFEEGCPFDPSHKRKDAYVCVFPSGKAIFKCLHESCSGYGWHDFIRIFDPDHASAEEKAAASFAEVMKMLGNEVTTEEEPEPKKFKKVQLEYGKNGVVQSMANLRKALSEDTNLKGLFGINELTGSPENRKTGNEWRDVDDVKVFEYLETTYGLNRWEPCLRAISLQHEQHQFNPVIDKLNSLVWDGIPRIETSLIEYLGAEDDQYSRDLAKLLFLGAVMRIYEPGSKFDNMVVLLGKQGCGKSTFVRRMALDDKFFTDSVRGVGDREGAEQLRGAWIVEWGEMSAMKRARDAETIKLFISQQYDRYRPSYGRYVRTFPRMCIFVGTTNDQDFLSDRTGNRRFFPIKVDEGEKDIWGSEAANEFEQMMAEAVSRYRNGERPVSSKNTEAEANTMRDLCIEEDPREGVIAEWLSNNSEINTTCTRVIWYNALREFDRPLTMKDSRIIGRILDNLPGWERSPKKKRFGEHGEQRAWVKKDKSGWEKTTWLPKEEENK